MRIRLATPADAAVLIEFNSAMALETERKDLLAEVISAGVHGLLGSAAAGFYVRRTRRCAAFAYTWSGRTAAPRPRTGRSG